MRLLPPSKGSGFPSQNYIMNTIEIRSLHRKEQDILDRIENVKRLIQMETTLLTAEGARHWSSYCMVDRKGQMIGNRSTDNLLQDVRNQIQLQLLSITALCYGNSPDVGEPAPMLEWKRGEGFSPEDKFREMWEECLSWNA